MNYIFENWYVLIGIAVLIVVACLTVYKFIGMPTSVQKTKIKALLLLWVTDAEIELGSGTGKLKLRRVYDLFTDKFPVISFFISFDRFGKWVDEALEEMKILLNENTDVATLVNGTNTESE